MLRSWPVMETSRRRLILPVALALLAAWFLRRPLGQVAGLAAGGVALAFLAAPIVRLLEVRRPRRASALLGLLALWGGLGLTLWLALPALTRELIQVGESLPRSLAQLSAWLNGALLTLQRRVPGLIPGGGRPIDLSALFPRLATQAMAFAGGFADVMSKFSLMLVLSFFFLCDRDRLLLRLEWFIPQRYRAAAARAGSALNRELRLYLQGQFMVAALVGALAAAGLFVAGVRSALVLGLFVGLFNMVPYFGPFIGGVPAVLIALGESWQRAALCLGVLVLVQQLDNAILSPRVMGGITGLSPSAVLLGIYAGASFGGIVGMLAALPMLLSIRTVYRVFVQSIENI